MHKPAPPVAESEEAQLAAGIIPGMQQVGEGVFEFEDKEHDEHEGMDEASIREHEEVTKVKNVNFVRLGRHTIEAWYFSPFPQEYWKVRRPCPATVCVQTHLTHLCRTA